MKLDKLTIKYLKFSEEAVLNGYHIQTIKNTKENFRSVDKLMYLDCIVSIVDYNSSDKMITISVEPVYESDMVIFSRLNKRIEKFFNL